MNHIWMYGILSQTKAVDMIYPTFIITTIFYLGLEETINPIVISSKLHSAVHLILLVLSSVLESTSCPGSNFLEQNIAMPRAHLDL